MNKIEIRLTDGEHNIIAEDANARGVLLVAGQRELQDKGLYERFKQGEPVTIEYDRVQKDGLWFMDFLLEGERIIALSLKNR